jgi:glucokinase
MEAVNHIGAVDIGGTKIAVGVVDQKGQVLAKREMPTLAERGPGDAVKRIKTSLLESLKNSGGNLAGIGIGSTGPVYPMKGEIGKLDFLLGWEGFNIVHELSSAFNLPVALENDADAAALGEYHWGAGESAARFLYVTVSTGIGTGFVLDGKIYRGVNDAHPEMGHHIIDPSGPLCSCGGRGCWESLASGPAMVHWMDEPGFTSAREICQAAEQGHDRALQAIERTGRYLGFGLANLVTLFVPDVIALGGGVMQSRHLFWDQIHATIRAVCGYVPYEDVRIVPAKLGYQAGLVGAACVWLHRYSTLLGELIWTCSK